MTMDSPERISSKMQPKYLTLEQCFILMSLYWMFSDFDFLILCLKPNKIDVVLSSSKCEYLIYYLPTSSKAY